MTNLQSFILGIVQGVTEFLPISSSGHLVLTPYLFGWHIPADQAFVFNVLVQLGTLLAVCAFFWRDLYSIGKAMLAGIMQRDLFGTQDAKMGWLIGIATVPAASFGLAFKGAIESAFDSILATSVFLLITGLMLVAAERVGERSRDMDQINWRDALIIGGFQLLALFPGISRSGSTITGGMARHLERAEAARFSFLMSVPIMVGAGLSSLVDLIRLPNTTGFLTPLIIGFSTSAVVGYLSIRWLLGFLAKYPLYAFAFYVTAAGAATLLSLLF